MTGTRRDFLRAAIAAPTLLSFGAAVPSILRRSALAAAERAPDRDTILVAIQLTGGNDGLNTVAPYEDDAYARGRPTLRLAAGDVHRIAPGLGLHPTLRDVRRLYDEKLLSIVQGVGYPNSSRDHDAAMRDWHTAAPDRPSCETGWLGRAIDAACRRGADVPGAFVGDIPKPAALNAAGAVVPRLRRAGDWALPASPAPAPGADAVRAGADGGGLLDLVRRTEEASRASAERVEEVLRKGGDDGAYPDIHLAASLREISRLIRADLGIRIFLAELGGGGIGGFDSHANQADNHGALLGQLGRSLAAFVDDLRRERILERVLVLTYSEFGRTVRENGRRGTDHGAAQPLLLAGGRLSGGLVGEHPSLVELDGDGLRPGTDFRGVYAMALETWLGLDAAEILGGRHEPIRAIAAS